MEIVNLKNRNIIIVSQTLIIQEIGRFVKVSTNIYFTLFDYNIIINNYYYDYN
jgi:hypothetical protein